jgi:hypothetical protein
MLVLSLSGQGEAAATTCRVVLIEGTGGRAVGLGLPMAFQPAISIEPMTRERPGWRPAPACFHWAVNRREVVIARHDGSTRLRRDAPWPNQPEFCES